MTSFSNNRFLIIAGQPKAGTTSLYDWLAQHPEICPSNIKEARFFLDPNYPLPVDNRFDGENLEGYAKCFSGQGSVYLDATPDYLYSDTFFNAVSHLPNAKVVVIRRDPAERMRSAYTYFRQRGLLSDMPSFADYVAALETLQIADDTPVELRALDHCKDAYIDRLRDALGARLMVIDFKDLRQDPEGVLSRVLVEIDLQVPGGFEFDTRQMNKSGEARSPTLSRLFYKNWGRAQYALREAESLKRVLRPLARAIQRALVREAKAKPQEIPAELRKVIGEYAGRAL